MSDLAASEYAVRREAFMRLWASGSAALPAVREATASSTAPTAAAARVLELLLKLDIQPQDNDELAELINLSRGAAPRAIMELASRGHWRLATELLKTNPTLLSAFRAQPRQDWLCVLVQYAFDQGDAAKSWPLVQQLLGPVQQQYLSVKTGLALETPASGWTTDQRALRLLFDGQPDEAWQLSPSLPVQQRIVLLSGKWDWLQQDSLRIAFLGNEPRSPRSLARQAAYRYLCGDRLGSDRLAAEALDLLQTAEATPPADNNPARNRRSVLDGFDSETEQLLVALLICGQGDAVHERVIKANSTDNLIYFADRLEYERVLSSFGLSENLNDFDPWLDDTLTKLRPLLRQPAPTRGLSEFQHLVELSTLLVSMGKSQQSIQLYQKLMDTIQDAPGVYRDQAWSFLASQGRNSQFRPHLIRLLDDRGGELSPEARERVLAALYPEWTAVASSLWRTAPPEFVQMPLATTTKAPAGEPGEKIRPKERRWALLERLWRFDRSLAQAERQTLLENWLRLAMREASRMDETLPQAASQMSAIALELGLRDLALNFAYAGSSRASADVAQVHMQTNRLSSAIEYWDQAIRSDPRQHRWLLEDIDACLTLGEDDKAQMLEASRWLRPLAADRMGVAYVQVASGLNEDGRHARAQEYGQAAFAMYDPDSSQFIQSAREYSESLRELEEFGTAAKVHRAANLMLLQERNLGYPLVALQHFVADELLTQAIAEVEAGHIEIALDCIARFEKLRPAGIEICELTYPRLVRQGRQSEADQLLQRCSQRMLSHLQKWSDDAGSHNNYAWMLARCNQRLDEAREHAEIAVKLSDGAPTYIDTLAEILFRQGQTDQAIQRAEQCVRLDPRHYHYRKQLDLFRTARREQQNSASAPARP